MSEPFFSIVIANYNHGQFIETAIRSVLDQSCQDFELIIVDGGSTDNSVEVIKKYADRIAWWCSEKDNGQSHAFNKGFSHATGRFLTWLNADDVLLPRTLEKAKAKLQKHPHIRWMTGNFFRFLDNGTIFEAKWGPHFLPPCQQKLNAPIVVFGPTSFFARDLFNEVGGFDESLHFVMDTDLWLRFKAKGIKQIRLNHYCWAFRMHEDSKTAEFGDHRHESEKLARMEEEKKRIATKNNYNPSRFLRYMAIVWRVLDGSLLVYLWNQFYWRGKKYTKMIGESVCEMSQNELRCMLFFTSPAIYREEWLAYMAESFPWVQFFAVYSWAKDVSRGFSMFPEKANLKKSVLSSPQSILGAIKSIRALEPNLLFFHGYNPLSLLAATLYAAVTGRSYLLFSDSNSLQRHSSDENMLKRFLLRFIVRKASFIGYAGTRNLAYWRSRGAHERQLVPLWFPVNNERILKTVAEKREAIKSIRCQYAQPKDYLVICCARLVEIKGVSTLLQAQAHLPSYYRLLIIGEGPQRRELEDLSKELKISDRCFFLGLMSNDEVILHLAASDVFVLPSYQEPFGLVLNEAIAVGLPVIASDVVGSACDLIEEGKNGFIFSPGDYLGLHERIKSCQSLRREDIERKRAEMMEKFSFTQNRQQLQQIFDSLRERRK